jgi:Na+-translocating ferredoxin:NAD+ oxidoreductase subunit G
VDWKKILTTGIVLFVFAGIGTSLVGICFVSTKQKIADNERARLLEILNQIIPSQRYDNDLSQDHVQVNAKERVADTPLTIYRARRSNIPVGVIMLTQAPDGYNGTIKLLVGIYMDGQIAGVRILAHKETPGLGDKIESSRSDWVLGFNGRSLHNPDAQGWRVKKDGGSFDQLTGATITPRAVVKAVHKALQYFEQHKRQLFAQIKKQDYVINAASASK